MAMVRSAIRTGLDREPRLDSLCAGLDRLIGDLGRRGGS
jgi:hypothetical protein